MGVELNSILVAYSKYRSIRDGLRKEARFMRKNIFKTDLQPYETAVIFGAESLMGDLVPKLSEMRSNTNLLACRFPLPENDAWKLDYLGISRTLQEMLANFRKSLIFQQSVRCRATYYQQQNRRFPPAFIRRFWLRNPNAHLYLVFGLCSSAMIAPVLHSCYLYVTMSKSEFDQYRIEQNAVVLERQKFGKGLWFPFLSNKDNSTNNSNQ